MQNEFEPITVLFNEEETRRLNHVLTHINKRDKREKTSKTSLIKTGTMNLITKLEQEISKRTMEIQASGNTDIS